MDLDLAQEPVGSSLVLDDSWHDRIVSGDPTATSELAIICYAQLPRRLRASVPGVHDPQLIDEAITDALMGYFKHPERYDPQRGELFAYLKMSARGDLLNLLEREDRRHKREPLIGDLVADREDGSEEEPEFEAPDNVELEVLKLLSQVPGLLDQFFKDADDRQVVDMMLDGVRETSHYAALLGLTHLAKEQQADEVKRRKDRITKKAQRKGKALLGGIHDD